MAIIDRTGQRYDRLIVLDFAGIRNHKALWRCRCDCGKILIASAECLSNGHTRSCGCLKNQKASERLKTHGETDTRLHRIWRRMKARCNNPHTSDYSYYGARGVRVCDEWQQSYESFRDWAHAHGYSEDLTIDRIDVNKGYSPENCRWVDRATQARNKRSVCHLTFKGETKTAAEWSRDCGIPASTIKHRILRGWTVEKALTVSVKDAMKIKHWNRDWVR